MPILDPLDSLRVFGVIHAPPALLEGASQGAGREYVREGEGDDDCFVDGEEGEHGDAEPWLSAFFGGWSGRGGIET